MAKALVFVCAVAFIGLVYAQNGFDTTLPTGFDINNKGDIGIQNNNQANTNFDVNNKADIGAQTNNQFTNTQQGVQINNFCSDPKWMALMNAVKDVIDDTVSKHSVVKRLANCECNKLVSLVKSVPEPLQTPVQQTSY